MTNGAPSGEKKASFVVSIDLNDSYGIIVYKTTSNLILIKHVSFDFLKSWENGKWYSKMHGRILNSAPHP